jgi:dihydroorotate dehydrogenase
MFSFTKYIYPVFLAAAKDNPEAAHRQLIKTLSQLDSSRHNALGRLAIKQLEQSFCWQNERLKQNLWGLNFPNPLGLAAGFDKDGIAAGIWSSFGFGFAELGAVTLHAQPGNPLPRLFRLPLDRAALNRMGANNLGAAAMADTLQQTWQRHPRQIPIGINLCKSKITSLEDAAKDYLDSFNLLKNWADYFVVNVSSPNTPGLRSLQAGEQLEPILTALTSGDRDNLPILIKIAPDLEWDEIAAIVRLARDYQLAGIIATNTTISRNGLKTEILEATGQPLQDEAGGISGAPLKQRSTEVIRFIFSETQGTIPIVGVGGIFNAQDAWEKIIAGASLIQVYTGWVYQGPWLVKNILEGLVTQLERNGLDTISSAVGLEHRR